MKFNLVKFKLKPKQVKGLDCLNCGQPLTGNENFCSYCGQKNSIKKLSFGVFISNIFSGFFSYDSRFWITFIPLLTKPGKVSKEYIGGKRARFVNPFQLYLNVSIIFFIILGLSNRFSESTAFNGVIKIGQDIDSISQVEQEKIDSIAANVKDELIKTIPNDSANQKVYKGIDGVLNLIGNQKHLQDSTSSKEEYAYHIKNDTIGKINLSEKIQDFYNYHKKHKKYPASQALDSLGYKKSFWNKFYYSSIINSYKNIEQIQEDSNSVTEKLLSKISIVLFIFLPIFTLFLKLIYIRRNYTYMEHLVFVFHTQTVFFLLLSIFYLLNFFIELSNFEWIFIFLFLIYLYKALRCFYGQGRFKTLIKFMMLNSFYMFLAVIGLIITAMATFILS
jgi:hypothetical protein